MASCFGADAPGLIPSHKKRLHPVIVNDVIRNTSRYRGVSWEVAKGKWKVRIRMARRYSHIAYVDDEIEAAKLWDEVALALHGPSYANQVNFPAEGRRMAAEMAGAGGSETGLRGVRPSTSRAARAAIERAMPLMAEARGQARESAAFEDEAGGREGGEEEEEDEEAAAALLKGSFMPHTVSTHTPSPRALGAPLGSSPLADPTGHPVPHPQPPPQALPYPPLYPPAPMSVCLGDGVAGGSPVATASSGPDKGEDIGSRRPKRQRLRSSSFAGDYVYFGPGSVSAGVGAGGSDAAKVAVLSLGTHASTALPPVLSPIPASSSGPSTLLVTPASRAPSCPSDSGASVSGCSDPEQGSGSARAGGGDRRAIAFLIRHQMSKALDALQSEDKDKEVGGAPSPSVASPVPPPPPSCSLGSAGGGMPMTAMAALANVRAGVLAESLARGLSPSPSGPTSLPSEPMRMRVRVMADGTACMAAAAPPARPSRKRAASVAVLPPCPAPYAGPQTPYACPPPVLNLQGLQGCVAGTVVLCCDGQLCVLTPLAPLSGMHMHGYYPPPALRGMDTLELAGPVRGPSPGDGRSRPFHAPMAYHPGHAMSYAHPSYYESMEQLSSEVHDAVVQAAQGEEQGEEQGEGQSGVDGVSSAGMSSSAPSFARGAEGLAHDFASMLEAAAATRSSPSPSPSVGACRPTAGSEPVLLTASRMGVRLA